MSIEQNRSHAKFPPAVVLHQFSWAVFRIEAQGIFHLDESVYADGRHVSPFGVGRQVFLAVGIVQNVQIQSVSPYG